MVALSFAAQIQYFLSSEMASQLPPEVRRAENFISLDIWRIHDWGCGEEDQELVFRVVEF